jgi:hypothetical protein
MGDRVALIITSDVYQHGGLRSLRAPAQDAVRLAEVLSDPAVGGYSVSVLHNAPSHALREAVEAFFDNRQPDDVLVLYFSCHGLKNAVGELFLAATDTKPTLLGATTVPAAFVNETMSRSRARSVALLLDCCYGGAYAKGTLTKAGGHDPVDVAAAFPQAEPGRTGRGRIVITASGATEYALDGDRLADGRPAPSLFTEVLVRGLATGDADRDRDGVVEIGELFGYIEEQLGARTARQTPHMWALGKVGAFPVAATPPARRIIPSPLPADLPDRAADRDPDTRLAAVRDLRRILLDDDIALAAAAIAPLHRLSADDSARVAQAAAGALGEARLTAWPDRVDFGTVPSPVAPAPGPTAGPPSGPAAASTEVRLIGPPIAHVRHVVGRERWLTVESTQTGVRIGVDAAALAGERGPRTGTVSLIHPLGTTDVTVTATVGARRALPRFEASPDTGPGPGPGGAVAGTGTRPLSNAAAYLAHTRALVVSGAVLAATMAWPPVNWSDPSPVWSFVYELLRVGMVAAATAVLQRRAAERTWRLLGIGLALGSLDWCAADVAHVLADGAFGFAELLELLAAVAFALVIVVRLRPDTSAPGASPGTAFGALWGTVRALRPVRPDQRPGSWPALAATLVLLITSFLQAQSTDPITGFAYTISVVDGAGLLSVLFWTLPIGLLCAAPHLLDAPAGRPEPLLVAGASAALFLPDAVLMLTLMLSGGTGFLGDEVYVAAAQNLPILAVRFAAAAALVVIPLGAVRRRS